MNNSRSGPPPLPPKPDWWPENPYPEDIFPMTGKDYVKAIPDSHLRTAITGCIARWAWKLAERSIWERWVDHLDDL